MFSLYGAKFDIPICCIIWFESVWCTEFRSDRDINSSWYEENFSGYDTSRLNQDRILCPDCIVRIIKYG